jgi:hypothetical protein
MTPAEAQWLTLGFVIAVTVAVLGFDVWIIREHGLDASISRVVGRLMEEWPTLFLALVFWLGLLVGHVCLPAR